MSRSRGLRETLVLQGTELCARDPNMLKGGLRQRIPVLALGIAAAGVYFAALLTLDISPSRIVSGLGRLADIALLMFPRTQRAGLEFCFISERLAKLSLLLFSARCSARSLAAPLASWLPATSSPIA